GTDAKCACAQAQQTVVSRRAELAEYVGVGVVKPKTAGGGDGIGHRSKYWIREGVRAVDQKSAVANAQEAGGIRPFDSERADTGGKFKGGSVSSALVEVDAGDRLQVGIAVAGPACAARTGKGYGDLRGVRILTEVYRAALGDVSSEREGVSSDCAGRVGREGAARRDNAVGAPRQRL